jgi:hypothetical protein
LNPQGWQSIYFNVGISLAVLKHQVWDPDFISLIQSNGVDSLAIFLEVRIRKSPVFPKAIIKPQKSISDCTGEI